MKNWFTAIGLLPRKPLPHEAGLARKHCIPLRGGRLFNIANPNPVEIFLSDIAYGLAGINRFTGQTRISVAVHSLNCSYQAVRQFPNSRTLPLACLLHDAAEAYCGDVSRPLKEMIGHVYRPIEARLQNAVWQRFGLQLTPQEESQIKAIDNAVVRTEAQWHFAGSTKWNWDGIHPANWLILPVSPATEEANFLAHFKWAYLTAHGRCAESGLIEPSTVNGADCQC